MNFPTAGMGGRRKGAICLPHLTPAQRRLQLRDLQSLLSWPGPAFSHHSKAGQDPRGNGEGANPLPLGPRMRKFPCKCQADHRHRASCGGDKCKFLWRRRDSSQGRELDRGLEKEPPTHSPRSGVSPGVQSWVTKRAF